MTAAAEGGSTSIAAAKVDLVHLLKLLKLSTQLDRTALAQALSNEDSLAWSQLDRVALLKHLQSIGVARLSDRQAIVNGFGRLKRGQDVNTPAPPPLQPLPPVPEIVQPAPSLHPPPSRAPKPVWESHAVDEPSARTERSEAIRAEVRRYLLTGAAGYEGRGGYVCVVHHNKPGSIKTWTKALGECGDSSCGCYRLAYTKTASARATFRNMVVTRTTEQCSATSAMYSGSSVRYVSVGCGKLLTDFEILCGLEEKGLTVESIVFVDRAYSGHAHEYKEAFEQVAGFFTQSRLCAFTSLDDLKMACEAEPELYGRATTYVHCDAEDIPGHKTKALAGRLLANGGLAFQLHNNGSQRSSREGYRRRREDVAGPHDGGWYNPPPLGSRKDDSHYSRLLEPLRLLSDEGCAPLVTARDIALALPGTRLLKVVHGGSVAVRAEPTTASKLVGVRSSGTEVVVDSSSHQYDSNGWLWVQLRYEDPETQRDSNAGRAPTNQWGGVDDEEEQVSGRRAAWMLTDGSGLGHGQLLAEQDLGRPLLESEVQPPQRSRAGTHGGSSPALQTGATTSKLATGAMGNALAWSGCADCEDADVQMDEDTDVDSAEEDWMF